MHGFGGDPLRRLFLALLIAAMFAMPFIPQGDQDSTAPAHISYVGHATISIVGNAGFLGLNATTGISWGSGTIDDPYIIDGWNIDASAAHGIRIIDATSYFEIRGCYVHDGASVSIYNGIHLNNTTNGVIRNNDLVDDYSGIHLESFSENNTISSNTCSFNTFSGIRSLRSNSSSIENNLCFNSGYANIDLDSASNMTVANNTCHDGPVGIYLDDTFTSLPRCSINTVMNNTCHSNIFGIYLDVQAHNNTIESNTVYSNTQYGIFFTYQSNHNMISLNNISTNTNRGIFLNTGCYNNICWNNTLTDNNGGGTQAYDDGTNNWWNTSTGYGNYWSDWTIPAIPDIVSPFGILDLPYIFGIAQDYYPRYILIIQLIAASPPHSFACIGDLYYVNASITHASFSGPVIFNLTTDASWLNITWSNATEVNVSGIAASLGNFNASITANDSYSIDWLNWTFSITSLHIAYNDSLAVAYISEGASISADSPRYINASYENVTWMLWIDSPITLTISEYNLSIENGIALTFTVSGCYWFNITITGALDNWSYEQLINAYSNQTFETDANGTVAFSYANSSLTEFSLIAQEISAPIIPGDNDTAGFPYPIALIIMCGGAVGVVAGLFTGRLELIIIGLIAIGGGAIVGGLLFPGVLAVVY